MGISQVSTLLLSVDSFVSDEMTGSKLSWQITEFVVARTEAIIARFLPDFVLPGFFCGHRLASGEGPNLAYLLAHLHALGVTQIAGIPIEKAIAKVLRRIDGPTTETFYSFFVANTLQAFGTFEGNPLLSEFTAAERENIRTATDTTHIYDPETNELRGFPNNYWAVLARCEFTRQQLGILPDDALLRQSVERLQGLLFRNPVGFFDDSREGRGRYDIYTADAHLFCEPLWPLFEKEKLESNLLQHARLLEKMAMENGASFVFGRSIGPLSICLTMEFLAMSLQRGHAADPARSMGLIWHAFESLAGCFEDDLIAVHRHGNTEAYRGIHRVLQMSIDCLAKLCYAAEKLHEMPEEQAPRSLLFPDIDELVSFDDRNGGVWLFRNTHFAFQLALIDGDNADYVPWPRSPGFLENPVSSPMLCGVLCLARGPLNFTTWGLPSRVEKGPDSLTIAHEGFRCVTSGKNAEPLKGRSTVRYRVEGDALVIEENLFFDELPEAISFFIPDSAQPLDVVFQSDQAFHADTVAIDGMAEWRSAWGGLRKLHQAHFQPAREIHFRCTIRPRLRVSITPGTEHDYPKALIEKLSPRQVVVEPRLSSTARMEDLPGIARELDIFHFGWPEYLLTNPGIDEEKFDRQRLEFASALGKSGAQIVWTMHNRRPHWWPAERGKRLYDAWAQIADGVIHHSAWGMKVALATFPFRPGTKHVVIPHGHFREQMQVTRSRAELEAQFRLPPCKTRFGLLGRWQPEKRVETVLAAFVQGARPGQQLVVTAYDEKTPRHDDPWIIFLPRKQWMSREDIAAYTQVCDALVSAHTGDTYFTSGISADAIGVGIPMLAPHREFFDETFRDAVFYHDNTEESLAALFESISPEEIENKKAAVRALQPESEWSLVAEKTIAFYRSLGRKRK